TDEFTSVIDALPSGLSGIKKLYEFFRIIVFPEDYDDFIKYTSSERVDRYAAMGKSCSYNFRVMRDGKTEYFRIRITRSKEMSDCCVITLLNINDDYLLREKLENDEKRLEYLAVIENFSQDYDSISYIRLGEGPELDRPITYRISEKLAAIIPGWTGEMNYRERMTLLMEHFVIKEDRAIFNLKVQREVIMEALRRSGIYFVNFRAYNGKDEQYYQLKYTPVYDSNGEMRAAISGLHNIDDEMRRELQRNDEITAIVEERTASLKKANAVLSNISDSVLEIMAGLVESRSAESGTHIRRVKGFTRILAEQIMNTCPEYGLTKDRVENITQASALHDIGKIAIPDSVLLKPGKLTPEERDIMMTHSARGAEIIEKMSSIWDSDYINTARDISLYHHEKWDGGGYPCGLKGDDIPIAAQIVSIADIYDALTNERCYKRAFTPEEAYNMIVAGECGKFSARMMACFKACRAAFEAYAINPVEPDDRRDTKTVDLQFRMPEHIRDRIFISDKLSLISSIAEHLPNGFFAYRDQGDGELILFNDVLVRMFGCESREEFSEYIGSTFRGIVHPDDYDRTQKTIYSQIASSLHDMDHVIYRITRKDGEVRTIDDYGHLVHSLDLGDVFFVCLSDISGYSTIGDEYDVGKILDKMRILLVDDDELSRDICRELLELEGASVTEAESGPDALRIIGSTHPFDMILTDVIMPGMDGVEFIRKLRESYPEVNTTVIACSADDSESMLARCMDAGADSFVKKPLNISDLSQKMISCMKRKFDSMGRQLKSTIDLINTDPLTGCQNITAYTLKVGELDYAIKKDTQEEFAVLVCDINDLKQENNDNGHNSGDLCIRNCCDILCKIFSRSAVYRIGGDEFTVILEGDECAERSVLMRRLYLAVEKSMRLPPPRLFYTSPSPRDRTRTRIPASSLKKKKKKKGT
ncbi:MAG: hypothetical protein CW338_11645, partial [Clostridiales bacterium]|nr:hypothetical protein [Clostridiales bacterium]